ncbi:MAG: AMP-binding protein [Eubacteriales bacterium]
MEAMEVNYSILTPLNFLNRNAEVYPDKVAVVYGDKRFMYRKFNTRVNNLAGALSRLGLGRGDKVAFFCPNTPPLLEAHYGVPMAGGVLVAINTRLSPGEIKYILNHSESKVLVIDAKFSRLVKPILNELTNIKAIVSVCEEGIKKGLPGPEYEDFLATGAGVTVKCPIDNELEIISINYTSGTTGLPKGVMYSYRGAYLIS